MSKQEPIQIYLFMRLQSELMMQKILKSENENISNTLNASQILVLMVIDREFGSHQSYIADKLMITKQSIGSSINLLIKKKYVIKIKDPVDGRASLINLTDKGWKLIDSIKIELEKYLLDWKMLLGQKTNKKLISAMKEISSYSSKKKS
ncbi:MAG: winged helix-turn-helix transcriptional regulator [Saprospiraceae bacterium]|nr:winged helix-turn-helix transcriptional regulator [Saprospiraceae bacterium]